MPGSISNAFIKFLFPVYKARHVCGAEPVVYVYHTNACAARIEHGEHRCKPPEVRPVSDACGNGNDGPTHKPRHNARERPFHPCADDQHVCRKEYCLFMEKPV